MIGPPVMYLKGRLADPWLVRTPHDAFPYIRDAPVTEARRQRSVLTSPAS